MRAGTIAAIRAVAKSVSDALKQLDEHGRFFWDLPPKDIAEVPPEASPAWGWRAWSLLMGAKGVGIAVAHKTLHHKRPSVFPLIDNLRTDSGRQLMIRVAR
jgi:hypothetical protein